jgi:glucosamine--fructose-6-phosphate aminotransferase (isomerizing)
MCGIIGICLSNRERMVIGKAILNGLLRLEYRGYDSAGVAVVEGEDLKIVKGKGKILELESKYNFSKLQGVLGIGHTRWATHGPPTDQNAHPHVDCTGLFAIVHNGIIENYAELKEELRIKGHAFKSDTDSEVFAHLVEEYYRTTKDVYEAFKHAVRSIRGTYAILMITPLQPDRIFFAKKDSPLIIGIGDGYNVVASDIPAILDHTRRVIVLRDHWVGYVTASQVHIEDLQRGLVVDPAQYLVYVDWSIEEASKEGYPHYMLKEIHEQPKVLAQTLSGLRSDRSVEEIVLALLEAGKIFITAAGTSYHASEFFAYTLLALSGRVVIPFIASEYTLFERAASSRDVLIAVSQSGETIDVLKALRAFKSRGCKVIAVSNVVGSAIPRESDYVIYTRAGPEIGVAATKTFLAQTLVLSYIALNYAYIVGAIDRPEYFEILNKAINTQPKLVEHSVKVSDEVAKKLSHKLRDSRSIYILSRGLGVPIAKEGALKIKEIAYIHAEAYPAGESKHGPIALVEPGFPVIFVVPNDPSLEAKMLGNIEEMRARGAFTIGIIPEESRLENALDYAIKVESPHWIATPATHTPLLQLLAYYLAVLKGLDPDKPRNLAKTVTVE